MNSTLVVNQPDGSAVVGVQSREDAGPGVATPGSNASLGAAGGAVQRNPFPEHDRVASNALAAMQQRDAAAWEAHSPAAPVRPSLTALHQRPQPHPAHNPPYHRSLRGC